MFWGLQLEAGKRYSQVVPDPFLLSKATLDASSSGTKVVQVFVEHDGAEYAIATLKPGAIYDSNLNLQFSDGEEISFYIKGEGVVYLTGHSVEAEDESFYPGDDDSSDDSEEEPQLVGPDGDSDEGSDDSDGPHVEEMSQSRILKQNGEQALKTAIGRPMSKQEMEAADDDDDDSDLDGEDFDEDDDLDEEDSDEDDLDEEEDLSDGNESEEEDIVIKAGDKRLNGSVSHGQTPAKKVKMEKKAETPAKTPKKGESPLKTSNKIKVDESKVKTPKAEQKTPKGKETGSVTELKVEDIRSGSGPLAKPGKTVHVYYSGTLLNGSKFDQCTNGKPFSFRLGKGDVIKGWDQGINGMKVGGKRRLIVPSHLAYGSKRVGPIPPNSVLKFEVELKAVN